MSAAWGDLEWHIEDASQFWSELEDILKIPKRPTLDQLDRSMCTYIKFCAEYHYDYLLAPLQLGRALDLVLASVLFKFHSTRMVDLIVREARKSSLPHSLYIIYALLLRFGQLSPALYRDLARWRKVLPGLMNALWADVEDRPHQLLGDIPIEAKLRTPATSLMYEVCRVQKLDASDLELFDERFVDHLFTLVERTRLLDDETLNYALIKLIVALNEQFMVATLAPAPSAASSSSHPSRTSSHPPNPHQHRHSGSIDKGKRAAPPPPQLEAAGAGEAKKANRILSVLLSRLGASKTFGENMIFMLNRAENTPEDLCMQLLILKILYLLFTTSGTKEYFYTNDLKVLVDVFIRELSDLPEESEALRHTYLRVLHPLLTNTQLRTVPYKRPHLLRVLRSLTANPYNIRDVTPTTIRLVDRCLSGDWCVSSIDSTSSLTTNDSDGGGTSPGGSGFSPGGGSRSLEDGGRGILGSLSGLKAMSLGAGSVGGSVISLDQVAGASSAGLPRTRRKTTSGDRWSGMPDTENGSGGAGLGSLGDVTEGKALLLSAPELVITNPDLSNLTAVPTPTTAHAAAPNSPPRRHRSPPPRPASAAAYHSRQHEVHHTSHHHSVRHASHSTSTSHSHSHTPSSSTSPHTQSFYQSRQDHLSASPSSSTVSLPLQGHAATAPSSPSQQAGTKSGRRKPPPPPPKRNGLGNGNGNGNGHAGQGAKEYGEHVRTGWETFG